MTADYKNEHTKWALVTGDKLFKLAGLLLCWSGGLLAGVGAVPALTAWAAISITGLLYNTQEQLHQRRINSLLSYAGGLVFGIVGCVFVPPSSIIINAAFWLASFAVAKETVQFAYAGYRAVNARP